MASIIVWTANQVLTVTTFKRLSTAPDKVWHNTYEVAVTEAGSAIDVRLPSLGVLFAAFEEPIHLPDVEFVRTVVSTYVPDGEPYNPATFASYTNVGLVGVRDEEVAADRLPLEMCLRCTRNVNFGRRGMLLYRRALVKADVESIAGKPALSGAALEYFENAIERNFNFGGTSANLETHLDELGLNLVMAAGPEGDTNLRSVTAISPEGVSVKKMNNRYFDRAPVISG